jgi:hypothetical protein
VSRQQQLIGLFFTSLPFIYNGVGLVEKKRKIRAMLAMISLGSDGSQKEKESALARIEELCAPEKAKISLDIR